MTTTNKKWSEDTVAKLVALTNAENPVSAATVASIAVDLGVSERSVASKLRQLDMPVASLAKVVAPSFTAEEGAALKEFIESNPGKYTYKELAEVFNEGQFNAKQVQGKVLALELTGSVKPTEKVEAVKTYTSDEESKFISLAKAGKFIEEIAEALGKTVASVRGKALSLTRQGDITEIPKQKESHAKESVDPVDVLGGKITTMTVAAIAEATGKTDRGIKTLLTRRGIDVADYKGAAKAAKAKEKAAAAV